MIRRIRIATYNIHKCKGLDRRTSAERIADVIQELDADIIAIQEIMNLQDGLPKYDQARTIHKHFENFEWRFGENRTLHGGPYGNMTLSRLPIRFCRNYDLTWRSRERRGCLRTDVSADGRVLHIFNVHLGTSFFERRNQSRKLLSKELLNSLEYRGPRIVIGDFNEWTRGLVSRSMTDAFESIDYRKFKGYGRSYPGILPLLRLDHFYYDKQLSLRNFHLHRSRTALIASDHLPQVAEFEMESA